MTQFEVPIAFIVFNRPDTTMLVFKEIRRIKPLKLLIIADGPRINRPGEADKCARVRAIVEQVDWPCEVFQCYAETNMGCRRRVSSGLDWVFEQVEEAIILEDDCVPHPSFFPFCKELLEKYRNDKRVFMISGDNFQFGRQNTSNSYYFSMYPHVWGWASWRRSWQYYDVNMSRWPEIKHGGLINNIFINERVARFWNDIFTRTYEGKIDTWDFQLTFTSVFNDFLCIVPCRNLVSNIGFAANATHTKNDSKFAELPVESIQFPLIHPSLIVRDAMADELTENEQYFSQSFLSKIMRSIGRIFHVM